MSSPPGTPKKKLSETISFIRKTNPEVFKVSPRPGGILQIQTSDGQTTGRHTEDDLFAIRKEFEAHLEEKISKEFRVQAALEETESLNSEDETVPAPRKDAMYVFGVAISTLIMMATKQSDIPKEYLEWTTQCLESVRDDFGNHPPNVQGILNHLKTLEGGGDGGDGGEGGAGGAGGAEGAEGAAGAGGAEGAESGAADAGAAAEGEAAVAEAEGETAGGGTTGGTAAVEEGGEEGEEEGGEEEEAEGGEEGQTVRTKTTVKMGQN